MKTERTLLGLRDLIFDEIDALKSGTSTPQKLAAVARAGATILNSARIELEIQKHAIGMTGTKKDVRQVLQIGTGS